MSRLRSSARTPWSTATKRRSPSARTACWPKAPLDALRGTALVVATEDSAYGEYVVSVASLAQGDCGGASGWTFTVNGEYPETSAGETVLQEGDEVVWAYYCEPQA